MPPEIVARLAFDRYRILREYSGRMKKRPMMFAAIETMTKANPVWPSRRHNSHFAAQTTAREPVHAASPPKSSWECLQRTALSVQLPAAGGDASLFGGLGIGLTGPVHVCAPSGNECLILSTRSGRRLAAGTFGQGFHQAFAHRLVQGRDPEERKSPVVRRQHLPSR